MAKGRRPQGLHRADVIRTLRFTPAQDVLFELLKTRRGRLSVADMVKFWMISEARRVVPNAPELAAVEREANWQLGLFADPRNADAPPSSSAAAVKLDETPPAELDEGISAELDEAAGLDETPAAELDEGTAAPAAEVDEQEVDEDTLDSAERAWSYPKCAAECGNPAPFNCPDPECNAPLCARLECRVKHDDGVHARKNGHHAGGEGQAPQVPEHEEYEAPLPVVNVPEPPDGNGNREYVPVESYASRCPGSDRAGLLLKGWVRCLSCKGSFAQRVGKGMSSIVRPHTTDGTLLPHEDQEQAICPGSYIDGYSDTPEDLHESVTCAVCFKKIPPGKGGPLLPAWHTKQGLVVGPFKTPRPKPRALANVGTVNACMSGSSTSKGAAKASKGSKASSSTSKPRARKGAA